MGNEPAGLLGLFALALIVGVAVAAWIVGRRSQRATDEAEAARIQAAQAAAEAASAVDAHADAVDRMDPGDLREHSDSLADEILNGGDP